VFVCQIIWRAAQVGLTAAPINGGLLFLLRRLELDLVSKPRAEPIGKSSVFSRNPDFLPHKARVEFVLQFDFA